MDVAVCGKNELFSIWKQSWNEEDRKRYCEAKKDAKRVAYSVVVFVSCLELPNKDLGRREALLGLFALKMNNMGGKSKCI